MLLDERDPVNELYDRCCDLLEAAAAMRSAAGDAPAAAPAVLDALGAALHQLTLTVTALESATADAARGAREDEALRARARMRFSLWDLELHLRKARDAADQAQRRSADALSRAGVTHRSAAGL
jgi:hypothetical protein